MPENHSVQDGDKVYTSGKEGLFLPGIPIGVVTDDWKGYLEDRRPASNADPYKVVERIMTTLDSPRPMQEPLPLAFYK